MKILVIEFINYREWTETLGTDREWIIQTTQHRLAASSNEIVSKEGSFLLPLRYDYYLIPVDGISEYQKLEIFKGISSISPLPIRACEEYGKTPLEAQTKATQCLDKLGEGRIEISTSRDEDVIVGHFDLNGFSNLSRQSVYEAFLKVNRIYTSITEMAKEIGGITQYLGGDNIIVLSTIDNISDLIDITKRITDVKLGIGRGKNPRLAMKGATSALETIRSNRELRWIVKSLM
ncbi:MULTISPECIES: GTP cyclohydrolase IIa [Acidianus]|uniref:GTP cyclohydrolase III n=1 Tax=Candidatus Acidianus copahuensis TaxID=1160895 RepID=A0A031LLT1_9CREN|nr:MULTISPECIES: GTP cyclohydrolase IIa [Acidianus]EZQ03101.1 GTP cyclohydrolase [Candidatus Acidianus copahuensis]NON62473.1 GTP cyclohydrolase IIa [Acidianus sp. RZ1]